MSSKAKGEERPKPRMWVLLGWCTHRVKVTRVPGHGYGIRVYTNELLNQESLVQDKIDIGKEISLMLRTEDKCGNWSKMASRSRMRPTEKHNKRSQQ